jgi:hypothetical protein
MEVTMAQTEAAIGLFNTKEVGNRGRAHAEAVTTAYPRTVEMAGAEGDHSIPIHGGNGGSEEP